jgi:hypothetical protein
MPVKIQELVIQTRIKPDGGGAIDKPTANQVNQQQLEKRIKYNCLQAIENLLREQQER